MKKILYSFILFILNFINIPLKNLYKNVKKWYQPMKEEDKIIWIAFAPFYWILVGLVFLFGFPADKIGKVVDKLK